MTSNELLKNLLFLYDNFTAIIDLKNKMVNEIYDGHKLIAENVTYKEYADIFANTKKYNETSRDKMLRFITNIATSDEPFSVAATYETVDNEKAPIEVKGYKYDEQHLILIVCDLTNTIVESYDPLTKVYNREVMIEKVKEAIKNNEEFSLMIIDVDNFKLFNDTYGHMFGDIVLVETAASIKKILANRGYVGRIGGDEFLLLMHIENDYDTIHKACTEIRHAITNVSNHNIKEAIITATVGCASYPQDANNYDLLFKKADRALYRGKKKGRNCFIIYDPNKCGEVTEDDKTELATSFDQLFINSTNSNIVAGILEILNRSGDSKKNIEDSLTLIGNYFLLDRISLSILDPDEDEITKHEEWINPRRPDLAGLVNVCKKNVPIWRKYLDKTNMIKFVQLEANKDIVPDLYKILKPQKTSALLAFELKYMDRILGLIRFEMCSINRFWQQMNISSLMLISKIFSVFLNKEYEQLLYKKRLHYDTVTQIYNFTKWRDEVFSHLANLEEYHGYSINYFQIEGFAFYQDVFGSNYTDKILISVANALRKVLDDTNCLYCRVSEEKFLIFLPTKDTEYIESTFAEINRIVNEEFFTKRKIKLTAGVYLHNKMDTLTTGIDKASLARKQPLMPENGIVYFTDELYEQDKLESELEIHMYDALNDGEFLLYLQPKFNTYTNEIVGAEALTRWNFRHRKILTPNYFIPLFERNGFISQLDFKVFENVCEFLRNTIDKGYEPLCISVNVSRYQKDFDNYIKTTNSIREKYNIPASLIEIEITESMYIENIDKISNFIQKLHACGYRISMDDFGSGYSNLASLATLDFDLIKLDRGFCNNMENEKENIILSFVMNLAKRLNMDVLCEGVETQEFVEYLKTIGCNIVQGFLFERPIPTDKFINNYMKKNNG